MSITTNAAITSNSPANDRASSTDNNHHHHHLTSINTEHLVNEQYLKICVEDIPFVTLECPQSKYGVQQTRSRPSLRFRTQPITLTGIKETEENKNESAGESEPLVATHDNFQQLEHLTQSESIRRSARKKLPLKNYPRRQRLKTMREEPSETDGN